MNAQLTRGAAAAPARYYRPELDVLRFVAFMMVFINHAGQTDGAFWAQVPVLGSLASVFIAGAVGGAFGVDLFFALSAFLITTLLLKETEVTGTVDVRGFYFRRLLRIWPLYFFFLLLVRPLVHFLVPEEDFPWQYMSAYLLFAGNWACVLMGFPHSAAAPLWSVSIEEQFYLAWPWLVRRWRSRLITVSVLMIVVAFVTRICLVAGGATHQQIWANTLARMDPIACGMILAVIVNRKEIALSGIARLGLLFAAGVILILTGRFGSSVGVAGLITLPAGSVACVALILATLGLPMPSARTNPLLRSVIYLGRISYGLYVFHMIFVMYFHVPDSHQPVDRLIRLAASLACTFVAAAISYQLLERPFLKLKDRVAHVKSVPMSREQVVSAAASPGHGEAPALP